MMALEEGHKSIVEVLLFEGYADYSDCKDYGLVKEALVKYQKYQQKIMASLNGWLQVPDLCAIVTGYL